MLLCVSAMYAPALDITTKFIQLPVSKDNIVMLGILLNFIEHSEMDLAVFESGKNPGPYLMI